MAHPFASQVKKGSSAKFKAMTGKKSSGQAHPDEAQDKALIKKMIREDREYNVGGAVSAKNFARGGRAKGKKGGTNVNITILGGGKDAPPPMLPPMMPPKAPMAPPPGLDAPGAPGGMPGGGLPGMNRGGKVAMKGGSESGQGRLDKIKAYGLKKKG